MKITQDINDNGMRIVHAKYTEEEHAEAMKRAKAYKELQENRLHADAETRTDVE